MKEPYEEGVAHHLDPESCADVREDMGEALTGEQTGRAIELRNYPFGVPTLSFNGEGNTMDGDKRESSVGAAESRNQGVSLHPEKTRLIEFGRFAGERRAKRGDGKPETFDFLGFTHISGKTRRGAFTIKRRSNS